MRLWPFHRGSQVCPSDDARCALEQAHRALKDAKALSEAADDITRRAGAVGEQWRQTRARNHVAEAVVESIRRKAHHS